MGLRVPEAPKLTEGETRSHQHPQPPSTVEDVEEYGRIIMNRQVFGWRWQLG